MLKIILILVSLKICECVYVYSSFWAPRMLNYKVDVNFDPDAGRKIAEKYQEANGFRGEKLIADLGNGKGPQNGLYDSMIYGPVKVYSTQPNTSRYKK